jgi:hypothetical protein
VFTPVAGHHEHLIRPVHEHVLDVRVVEVFLKFARPEDAGEDRPAQPGVVPGFGEALPPVGEPPQVLGHHRGDDPAGPFPLFR